MECIKCDLTDLQKRLRALAEMAVSDELVKHELSEAQFFVCTIQSRLQSGQYGIK